MGELKAGNLTARIQFRKFDEVQYLANHFNDLASSLDNSISSIKKIVNELPPSSAVEKVKQELSKFKTSGR